MRPSAAVPGCTSILAFSAVIQAVSCTSTTESVEVDLLFPHNDTYAPANIIPVAFAVQHPETAANLDPSIHFTIKAYGQNASTPLARGFYDFAGTNLTGSDPVMQYGDAINVLNTEGTWELDWTLSYTNCSGQEAGRYSKVQSLVFSTKNGAQQPDLTAATTQDDTCSHGQGIAISVSGATRTEDNDNCPLLGQESPSPTPCNVGINASAASSVSASLTRLACATATQSSWCPKPTDSAALAPIAPGLAIGSLAFLGAIFGALGFVGL